MGKHVKQSDHRLAELSIAAAAKADLQPPKCYVKEK